MEALTLSSGRRTVTLSSSPRMESLCVILFVPTTRLRMKFSTPLEPYSLCWTSKHRPNLGCSTSRAFSFGWKRYNYLITILGRCWISWPSQHLVVQVYLPIRIKINPYRIVVCCECDNRRRVAENHSNMVFVVGAWPCDQWYRSRPGSIDRTSVATTALRWCFCGGDTATFLLHSFDRHVVEGHTFRVRSSNLMRIPAVAVAIQGRVAPWASHCTIVCTTPQLPVVPLRLYF